MDLSLLASDPVFLEGRVVWGGRSFYKHVPSDWGPAEFQEVSPCAPVPKYPLVVALSVEFSPVFRAPPLPRFRGVSGLDVSNAPFEHPVVYRLKRLLGYADTKVIRPSA